MTTNTTATLPYKQVEQYEPIELADLVFMILIERKRSVIILLRSAKFFLTRTFGKFQDLKIQKAPAFEKSVSYNKNNRCIFCTSIRCNAKTSAPTTLLAEELLVRDLQVR